MLALLLLCVCVLIIVYLLATYDVSYNNIKGKNTTKKQKNHPPVELVVTWTDGLDQKREALRKHWAPQNTTEKCRVSTRNELRYLLRSVETNAPWISRITIVASGHRRPSWLVEDNDRVRVVDDTLLCKTQPTFSSHAIEANFDLIPDLHENFLYACDDMMFIRSVNYHNFFHITDDEIISLYSHNRTTTTSVNSMCTHDSAWNNTANVLGLSSYKYPSHQICALKLSKFKETKQKFRHKFEETSRRRFRSKLDIHPIGLVQQHATKYWRNHHGIFCSTYDYMWRTRLSRNVALLANVFEQSPFMCINDSTNVDNEEVDKWFHTHMDSLFPTPSSMERNSI